MYEINCYDSYGNTIDYLTQWDYNRKLIMYIDNYDLSYAPEVHFCNQNSVEALVVQSVVEGNKLTVDIPNILLQEHLSLYAYVYLSDANNASSQKTILSVAIPVRYKPKPSDYTYIENISKITAAEIEQSIYDKVRTSIRDVVFEYLDENPVVGGATSEQAQQIQNNTEQINQFQDTLKELQDAINYVEIAITSFSSNVSTVENTVVNTVEIGTVVNDVTLTWSTNKEPTEADIDGVPITEKTVTLTGLNLTTNKTWKLTVKDEKDAIATKTANISFLNGAYYGVGNAENITNEFVLGLTKVLTSTRARNITVTANEGQYIYYAVPTRLGKCTFVVGLAEGGFSLVDTIQFTNEPGYTESYYIYKSNRDNLGETLVKIS